MLSTALTKASAKISDCMLNIRSLGKRPAEKNELAINQVLFRESNGEKIKKQIEKINKIGDANPDELLKRFADDKAYGASKNKIEKEIGPVRK